MSKATLELQESSADFVLHGRPALLMMDRCCVHMRALGGGCPTAGEEPGARSSGTRGTSSARSAGGGGDGAGTAAVGERHIGQRLCLGLWCCFFQDKVVVVLCEACICCFDCLLRCDGDRTRRLKVGGREVFYRRMGLNNSYVHSHLLWHHKHFTLISWEVCHVRGRVWPNDAISPYASRVLPG